MKKYLFLLMLLTAISLCLRISEAADLSVGLTSYYAYYEPCWKKFYTDLNVEPALLLGPVFNLSFHDNWSVSFLFIYSQKQFSASYTDSGTHIPGASADTGNYSIRYRSDVARYDSSLAIGYSFDNYKIFGGIKSASALTENDIILKESTNVTNADSSYSYNSSNTPLGLVAGAGFTYPVTDELFITGNGSLLYSVSSIKIKTVETIERPEFDENKFYDYHGFGGNGVLQLSYMVSSINTTFSIGGRYEILYLIDVAGDPYEISGERDMYYGIIFSAIYTFQ